MESNSIKNRIQVSQKTADLLMAAGKGHWLTARDTLVEAKGKGKMQTYWLLPNPRVMPQLKCA
jgi:Adenylate and Guanylate cyclase catalytic domain